MKHLVLILMLGISSNLIAQNTVGLLSYKVNEAYEGYNLIYPHNQANVYLVNNCGEIVHTWEGDEDTRPGNTAYLMENGDLIKTLRPASVAGNPIWAGGGGATIEHRTWDNELISTFTLNDENQRLHHDIDVLPTGNVLAICWELKTKEESIAAGRDTMNLPQEKMWPESILEIDMASGEVVWEWHIWDHIIQDFDETKDNYGVVADHPELVDINWDTNDGKADWLHANALDYNAKDDQIMISIPTFHEFWIIDHGTTTEQAAGSTGGLYGMGGDVIYRWGNPATYRAGDSTDQKLFYQHDTHWNTDFISPAHPDFGKVALFNNRVGADFSTVNILDPMFDDYEGNYMIMDGQYIPADFDLTLTHPNPQQMWSTGLSSFQQLPNDNYLIAVGRFGYSFEITTENEIVWEYITPLRAGAAVAQGDTLEINNNLTFRTTRYPLDFEAFTDRDLTSKGWIELEPNEPFCQSLIDSSTDDEDYIAVRMYPVPTNHVLTVDLSDRQGNQLDVYSLDGRKIYTQNITGQTEINIEVAEWNEGIYFITIDDVQAGRAMIGG